VIFPAVAGGDIFPARFLIASTSADNTVLQAAANGKIVGISQKGTRRTPYAGLDDGKAAIAGENVHFFGPPETAPLELGGTVTAGDLLEADANGKGVTSSTDGHFYGAIAPQAGASGDIIEVQVMLGMRGA
jgi:hypothetical protein